MEERTDIAVLGAGAAGLMASIWAGRTAKQLSRPMRITALDGARKVGAKILVAGGGRCNVVHHAVDETAYAGSSRHAIRKVLGRFPVARTIAFFHELGVELKREETGKLFPTTDDAHTVLDALLHAAADAGARVVNPWRVDRVERAADGFVIHEAASTPRAFTARRLILATGGLSLPKSGSDGHGYRIARSLGHTVTRTLPALVPLTLPEGHFLRALSGITLPATLQLREAGGRILCAFTNSTLFTHFGLSGPSVLDISRYYLDAAARAHETNTPAPVLTLNVLPHHSPAGFDTAMLDAARATPRLSAARYLTDHARPPLPERLARALCEHARLDPATPLHAVTRDQRRALVTAATDLPLPITGSKGYTHAEVTAGGIPLSEVHLDTMESRCCPGLHLCGEILDVDGRIGGFNFQWAWASGFIAGTAAANALAHAPPA